MALIYNVAAKTPRMTATRDYFANGTLEILTSADAVLVTYGLSVSGGSVATDEWTLALDATTVAATGAGIAAKAQVKTSGGSAHLTGLTVGMDPEADPMTDILLDNTNIAIGQNVQVNSVVFKHAT